MHPLLHVLRVRFSLDRRGADRMSPGPAIIVENHLSGWDPFVTVMGTRWRVSAIAKIELFRTPVVAWLMRVVGQIPIERGDEAQTEWVLATARWALADGMKIGVYPEGTRGPDHDALYKLHQRVLVPLIRQSPEVPVHAVTVRYFPKGWRRRVEVRVSGPLPIDPEAMTDDELTAVVRDALVEVSGLRYVDLPAWTAKRRAREEKARLDAAASGDDPA